MADNVRSPGDLAAFAAAFAVELERGSEEWSSLYLHLFLEAMAAWINDSLKGPDTVGFTLLHESPSWRLFARLMLAAATYD
jgi:hypothetical protein